MQNLQEKNTEKVFKGRLMEDLISVVVPIYNVENYIKKCVDSILNQTYKNLEIILVDDGSPDNCPQICDEYAQKDSRIKVIHKENGGLSDAINLFFMNIGLSSIFTFSTFFTNNFEQFAVFTSVFNVLFISSPDSLCFKSTSFTFLS